MGKNTQREPGTPAWPPKQESAFRTWWDRVKSKPSFKSDAMLADFQHLAEEQRALVLMALNDGYLYSIQKAGFAPLNPNECMILGIQVALHSCNDEERERFHQGLRGMPELLARVAELHPPAMLEDPGYLCMAGLLDLCNQMNAYAHAQQPQHDSPAVA